MALDVLLVSIFISGVAAVGIDCGERAVPITLRLRSRFTCQIFAANQYVHLAASLVKAFSSPVSASKKWSEGARI
jgi:hypothetical protein